MIGRRVHAARMLAGVSPQALAQRMGFSSAQAVAAIEHGQRAVTADELLRLAEELGQDGAFFTDPFAVEGEATFTWQASAAVPDATRIALEHHARGWVGMLRWLYTRHAAGCPHRADREAAPSGIPMLVIDLGVTEVAIEGGQCQLGELTIIFVNALAAGPRTRLFSAHFVGLLHEALEAGWVSTRKAAKVMRLDLDALNALFTAYDLTKPSDL